MGQGSEAPTLEYCHASFTWALGLNTGTSGAAENHIQLYVR